MKKKIFSVTVGGFYLCSVVLGVLAYLLMLVVPHDVNSWIFYQHKIEDLIEFWSAGYVRVSAMDYFLPSAKLYDWLYIDGHSYATAFAVTVAILFVVLSVVMMEGKGMNKVWRTKILQTVGFSGILVCVDLAYQYAWLVDYAHTVFPMIIFIPIVVMIVPLLILVKTRQKTVVDGKRVVSEFDNDQTTFTTFARPKVEQQSKTD